MFFPLKTTIGRVLTHGLDSQSFETAAETYSVYIYVCLLAVASSNATFLGTLP